MEFLLFNEVLKNLIFFQLPIKKIQILNANLWSIYGKIFVFMFYTFICAS